MIRVVIGLLMLSWAAVPCRAQPAEQEACELDGLVPIPRFRKQAIQNVRVSSGWLGETGRRTLSSSFIETSIGLGVPLGNFENILGVTPSFRVDWVDAAVGLDVPSELYQTGVELFWRKPLAQRWSAMAIVGPTVRSDFTTSDRALRIFGLGLLSWECLPETLSVSFGAVYLDRADISLLPAAGLTWTPHPLTRLELRFPESRLTHCLIKNGAEDETWINLTGGLGGNTWAVSRRSGRSDEVSLRDWRVMAGIERVDGGGGGWSIACGYAFDRRLEYESTSQRISLGDGILLEAGWTF